MDITEKFEFLLRHFSELPPYDQERFCTLIDDFYVSVFSDENYVDSSQEQLFDFLDVEIDEEARKEIESYIF